MAEARTAGGAERTTARRMLRQSDADLAAGRHDAAYQRLEQIIETYPGSREASLAKDRLVELFRSTRQARSSVEMAEPPRLVMPRPVEVMQPPVRPALPARPQPLVGTQPVAQSAPVLAQPVQPPPEATRQPADRQATLRRGGDDFKQSVGDRIFFDAVTARIDARQRTVLQAQAAWLLARPDTVVRIEGHADETGPHDLNAAVAIERAEAVRAILVREGVAADRIEVHGLANDQPIARCTPAGAGAGAGDREACASQNRRAVTVIEWVSPGIRRRLSLGGDPGTAIQPTPALQR